MMFSAELAGWFYCAQENGFLGVLENSRKKHRKSTHPKELEARSGTKGQPRGPQAPPWRGRGWVAPSGRLGASPLLWCPTEALIYSLDGETPKQKSFFQSTSRSRR